VGTATGHVQQSTATAEINLPQLPSDFPRTGHVMPGFKHTLMGVGPIRDANILVLFNKDSVKICDLAGKMILTVWRKQLGAKLWRMALLPDAPDANCIITPLKAAFRQFPAALLLS